MANVLMKRTVFDGKIYHHAGKKVEVSGPTLKKYLEKDWCDVIDEKEEVSISEISEPIETKEEKEIYETKEKKLRTRKK